MHRPAAPSKAPSIRIHTRLPRGWSIDHRTAPEFLRPRQILLQGSSDSNLSRRLLAAGLRSQARTDPATLGQLIRDLRNPELPLKYRKLVALVLGTLADTQAQEVLAAELSASRDRDWSVALLHALGAEKVVEEDDEIFDLPDSPFVYEISGLRLTIRTSISEDRIRQTVSEFLDHADVEIRRSAARALIHSVEHADLRRQFAELIRREKDENVQAGYGHALASWVARAPAGTPERADHLRALLDMALSSGNEGLRFRIEAPLGTAPLAPVELGRIAEAALAPPVERQLWSLSILSKQATTHTAAVEETCERLISAASDEKVREYAARALGILRTESSEKTLISLLADASWKVRLTAVKGLAGRPGAAVALAQTFSADSDERVRKAAEEALRK